MKIRFRITRRLVVWALVLSSACSATVEAPKPVNDAARDAQRSGDSATPDATTVPGPTDAATDARDASVDGETVVLPPADLEPGPCSRVRINTDGRSANVRQMSTTKSPVVGALSYGAAGDLVGQTKGEALGDDDTWYWISTPKVQGFVFSGITECVTNSQVHKGFYLPLECGKTTFVSQGNFSAYSHTGIHEYAYDIRVAIGDPLYAMAPGEVFALYNGTKPGHRCYDGGDASCADHANWVVVRHPDGTDTILAHLTEVTASIGQSVEQGDLVGYAGNTGFSGNPHVHVARRRIGACCQSIPLSFLDTVDGQPEYQETITSENCTSM